jgi:hypothetical protein
MKEQLGRELREFDSTDETKFREQLQPVTNLQNQDIARGCKGSQMW